MGKLTTAFVVALALTSARLAFATDVEDIPWTESNVGTLRGFDRDAIQQFVDRVGGDEVQHGKVGESIWADLAGDGRYRLVVTADTTGRSFFDALDVYERGVDGKVQVQSILGSEIHELSKVVRDLDGDGKAELIIPSRLDAQGPGGTLSPTVIWPKVYRVRNGKYVQASRDFPGFYDREVLPGLDEAIEEAPRKVAVHPEPELPSAGDPQFLQHRAEACFPQRRLASVEMTRDKVLRVLGRDATAGLSKAREWVANADPCLLGDAVVVLRDIGGHKDELRAAEEAQRSAMERERTVH